MADASPLLLASGSPRRRELLDQLGVGHRVVAADVDERALEGEAPAALVVRLARLKALAGLAQVDAPVALGADTVVVIDGAILGKPRDAADGAAMLRRLSGRTHEVHSGVAIARREGVETRLSTTAVTFRALEAGEIDAYWASGEPRDKAGGYAVQGRAARFITRIEGSYSGVMGLPLFETAELLAQVGLLPPLDGAR
jgi:septum formation protein